MNDKQKIMLFEKMSKNINKKFCENKIELSEIKLFKQEDLDDSFPKESGWYFSSSRKILIKKSLSLELQSIILVHEFVHAYQTQILKQENRLKHDPEFKELYLKFLRETEKTFKEGFL